MYNIRIFTRYIKLFVHMFWDFYTKLERLIINNNYYQIQAVTDKIWQ